MADVVAVRTKNTAKRALFRVPGVTGTIAIRSGFFKDGNVPEQITISGVETSPAKEVKAKEVDPAKQAEREAKAAERAKLAEERAAKAQERAQKAKERAEKLAAKVSKTEQASA